MVIFVCEAFSRALSFVSGCLSGQVGPKWVPGLRGRQGMNSHYQT